MGAITGTKVKLTEFAGDYKLLIVTATIAATSDTVTLTEATHGISTISGCIAQITGGMDADFQTVQVSYSGLVITLVTKQADGAASDEYTGTTVELWIIGT